MLAEATFTGETPRGWQEVTPLQPGRRHRRHDLRRLLPRPGRQLRLEPQLLRQLRRRQRPAARARRRRGRRQRRLRLRPEPDLPEQHLPVRELLGRRRLPDRRRGRHDAADRRRPLSPAERRHRRRPSRPNVTASFSEPMDAATISARELRAARPGRAPSSAPPSATTPATGRAVLDPSSAARRHHHLHGHGQGRRQRRQGPRRQRARRTTAPGPSPPPLHRPRRRTTGPGGPILAITQASNPFSRYYAEILRTEGLNEFTTKDISTVTPAMLAPTTWPSWATCRSPRLR